MRALCFIVFIQYNIQDTTGNKTWQLHMAVVYTHIKWHLEGQRSDKWFYTTFIVQTLKFLLTF